MSNQTPTLDQYYNQVKSIILDRQNPVTGLLPASTAVTIHGDYRDAWVRDNVYSILAVWALSLAYRKKETNPTRCFELEKSTIQLMRGLLRAMMRQAGKVEHFKSSLALHDALHAKYDTQTGHPVVGDHEWGHLQIDATSLYLLMLAQMTASGLRIIYNEDEVCFIQNLVYYVERAYRTPDYGIWERGEKTNVGYVELNASSIGMAKAALSAMSGFNLYGPQGNQNTTVHVMPDNIAMADITLTSMLPRESATKEVDSALLSVIGFPAFAMDQPDVIAEVRNKIRSKLGGKYGYKRFLRDGHQTAVEDSDRHYYNPEELKQFENIESEWPLFYAYEYLDALFREDEAEIEQFSKALSRIMVDKDGQRLIPELYYVPIDAVEAERKAPQSQTRMPNKNIPLVWAQSLFLLGSLLRGGQLDPHDVDPLGLHYGSTHRHPTVQVLVLAENEQVKAYLESQQIPVQCREDLPETIICLPQDLAALYTRVGASKKLGLSGRPPRRLKSLTTSRLFQVNHQPLVCISLFFLQKEFYLAFDHQFLVSRFKSELSYIHQHWNQPGLPLVTIMLSDAMVRQNGQELLHFLKELQSGHMDDVEVRLDHFDKLSSYTAVTSINKPDLPVLNELAFHHQENSSLLQFSGDQYSLSNVWELDLEITQDTELLINRLEASANIYEQIEILDHLVKLESLDYDLKVNDQQTTLRQLVEEIYYRAGEQRFWSVVRLASAILGKVDINLQHSINILLARQKIIQIGKAFSDDSLIIKPIPFRDLMAKFNTYCREDLRDRVFTQEILIYIGMLNKVKPHLLKDMITIRVSYITLLLTGDVAREHDILQEEALERLMEMAPSDIQKRLEDVLSRYQSAANVLEDLESLHVRQIGKGLTWVNDLQQEVERPPEGWLHWRRTTGTLSRLDKQFFESIWNLFEHCKGLIIGGKLEKRNRLDSSLVLSDMTAGEKAFAMRIEHLLSKIPAPEYRQLTLEAMTVTARFSEQNPTLYVDDHLVFDVVNGHAVRLAFLDAHPDLKDTYHDHKADAWTHFYGLSPRQTTHFLIEALKFLLVFEPSQLEEASLPA